MSTSSPSSSPVPAPDSADIRFTDIFNVESLQKIQDAFSASTGVASIITLPDGTPVTRPSHFCRLCLEVIRKTEKGRRNCMCSDALIGRWNPGGPVVRTCLSGGLWDAGASITVGGRHVANWLIGQVKNEAVDESRMLDYAREIGADEGAFREALGEVTVMSRERFGQIARFLFLLASELSENAYLGLVRQREIFARIRAESELRLERERLGLAVSVAELGVWDWDLRSNRLVWDEGMRRIYGIPGGDPVEAYDVWRACIHPDDVAGVDRVVRAAVSDGRDCSVAFRLRRRDSGEIRHVESSSRSIRDESGAVVRMVGMNRDVTARRLAEEDLRARNSLLSALQEEAPDGVLVVSSAGKITSCNRRFVEMWGLSDAALAGRSDERALAEVVDKIVDPDAFLEKVRRLYAHDDEKSRDEVALRDGRVFERYSAPVVDGDGARHGRIWRFSDVTPARREAAELREAKERFRSMFLLLPVGVCVTDPDTGIFCEANPAFLGTLGYSESELIGRTSSELGLWESPEARSAVIGELLARGAFSGEVLFRRKNGSPIPVNLSARLIRIDGLPRALLVCEDISERKRAELRDLHLRNILEKVAAGGGLQGTLAQVCRCIESELPGAVAAVFLAEGEGRLAEGDAAALPEALRRVVSSRGVGAAAGAVPVIVEDISREGPEDFVQAASGAGLRSAWVLPVVAATGRLFGVVAIFHRRPFVPGESETRAVGVFIEAARLAVESHHVRAEILRHREHLEELVRDRSRKLKENEQMLLTILDGVDACIYLKDSRGRYLFANRPVRELWHASLQEVVGSDDSRFFDAPTAEAIREADRRVLLDGETLHLDETNRVDSSGKVFTFQSTKLPLRDENGAIYALCGISTDVTMRKELEADLLRAKDAAEAANRAKSAFLSNMSHELRTPLNAILGYTQMMLRDRPADSPDAETLRIIGRSGEHLLGLINSVLDISKIEANKCSVDPEDFDLGSLLDEVVDILRRRAEEKGLRLSVDQSSSFPRFIRADRVKLRQVLLNIVGNAVKFTDSGGVTLRLATAGQQRPDGGGELVFTVADTGPGIRSEDMNRLFKPFEQAVHRPRVEGTGLGLALSRELVRLMGGDVRVSSEPGKGAEFVFNVAFAPVVEPARARLLAPLPGMVRCVRGAGAMRVLIVEDHPDSRDLLKAILDRFGFLTAVAENGESGVRLAREWAPHLVLMDRRMPVMDGEAATRKIRDLPEGGRIRIVAVTAEAFREDFESMMAAGCDAFVRKPYKVDEILEAIGRFLPVVLEREERKVPTPVATEASGPACAAFAVLPPSAIAALRAACVEADLDRVVEILTPYPEALTAADPFLKTFRADMLAALLPDGDPTAISCTPAWT